MTETVKKTTAKTTKAKTPKASSKPRKAAAAVETRATGKADGNVTEMPIPRERVAELARKFWAERGYTDGHHEEDWYRAERELRGKAS
jgi:Protein of unknown function (DUF2934)